jgi:hypothetical protein
MLLPSRGIQLRSPVLVLVVLTSACAPAFAEFADCLECDSTFTLTHSDLRCISKRIDRLLNRPEPVYFDATSCEQGSARVMSSSIPDIVPPSPSALPANKWLQLTKQQLQCLRAKLPVLDASTDDPVAISLSISDCPGQ